MKILIADDEAVVRDSLKGILTKGGGYEVESCGDGEECLKLIKKNLYDLVLLDLEMPKLDGYEILKQARVMYPDLPVAFITGKGQVQKIMESIAQYKLNAFIEKPFTPEKVLDIVGKLLKAKRPAL
ncbi:response regulator [Candidatus Saganbacteria bacterium]|nr:response regulator [Candidatus Saganbacteria bacterium]